MNDQLETPQPNLEINQGVKQVEQTVLNQPSAHEQQVNEKPKSFFSKARRVFSKARVVVSKFLEEHDPNPENKPPRWKSY